MSATTSMAMLLASLTLYLISRLVQRRRNGLPLPPGPKGLPLLGNINDMPKPGDREWEHWVKHKELYGPISSVTVMGQTMVIINDAEIAFDLLRDRYAKHSSRAPMVFAGDIVGFNKSISMRPYDESWRVQRKNIAKVTSNAASLKMFDAVQEVETAHFLLNVLESPDKLFDHIRKEAGSVILKITYGYNAEQHGPDPLIDLAGATVKAFSESLAPGKWAVDIFPFLRYVPEVFPGMAWKRRGREYAQILVQAVEQPFALVKHQLRKNENKTSYVSQVLEDTKTDKAMEFAHKWSAMALFGAGADTTVAALMIFFLAMSVFPEVQKTAAEEIHRVVGSHRLPVSADRDNLPYIMAVMKETHRWHTIAPMCVPHASSAEDSYRGYKIPQGALLLPNIWWFTHNPAVYPDPMAFRPERFIDTATHKSEPDPRNFVFGFGRRVCPGRYVADNALFVTIAQALAVFSIEKPVENGVVVEPEIRFEAGLVSHPVPYRVAIKPRSKLHEDLIKASELKYPWEESDAKALENVQWHPEEV
ncbi:cytochrome P450 [Calycina marina]|uniref:Cytochrome P450 n=1 Tax=Calycina marina TaxID=1763456 RepID=A0A9P7Z8G1_9HELO|nr:cytochrome P450 [Calycina marina]